MLTIFCKAFCTGIRRAFREAIRECSPERQAELREMREIANGDPFKLAIIESGMRLTKWEPQPIIDDSEWDID